MKLPEPFVLGLSPRGHLIPAGLLPQCSAPFITGSYQKQHHHFLFHFCCYANDWQFHFLTCSWEKLIKYPIFFMLLTVLSCNIKKSRFSLLCSKHNRNIQTLRYEKATQVSIKDVACDKLMYTFVHYPCSCFQMSKQSSTTPPTRVQTICSKRQ